MTKFESGIRNQEYREKIHASCFMLHASSKSFGFTLIELLVVISIIGILIGLSIFGLQSARTASRDSRRKADLELVRSGLEIYKADCNTYPVQTTPQSPTTGLGSGGVLTGNGVSSSACLSTNTYISQIPQDPSSPNENYLYYSNGNIYQICAALEQGGGSSVTCGSSSSCGTIACNYKVTNP